MNSQDDTGVELRKLQKKVAETLRQQELSEVDKWLEDQGEYYSRHPNEIIYAHTLVKAMKAIQATIAEDNLNLGEVE